ncbi:MAG: hypothetical protein WCK09_20590 [Bacteroidota bacterium]
MNEVKTFSRQFMLTTDDGRREVIAHERAALKAYYRAKKALIETIEDEEYEEESGFVTLSVRNVDDNTLEPSEWKVYQEYVVEPDYDSEGDDDDDDLDGIDETNVDDDENDD